MTRLNFSSDAKYLASAADDFTLAVWETRNWRMLHVKKAHSAGLTSVVWHPIVRELATAARDGRIYRWDLFQSVPKSSFRLDGDAAKCLVYSPDGHYLFAGTRKGSVVGWFFESNQVAFEQHFGPSAYVLSIAHHPLIPLLAMGSKDGVVRVWNYAATNVPVQSVKFHADWVDSVSFSSDGRWLLSASSDTTVVVWGTDRWRPANIFRIHTGYVQGALFVLKDAVVSASWNGQVLIWDRDTGEVLGEYNQPYTPGDWNGARLSNVRGLDSGHLQYLLDPALSSSEGSWVDEHDAQCSRSHRDRRQPTDGKLAEKETMGNPFIVLEGTHGAGKSTVARILCEQHGFYGVRTPPLIYEQMRDYIHREASGFSRFLYYMAGNADASREIRNALKMQPVVCDRYVTSTIASCHVDYGIELSWLVRVAEAIGDGLVKPDRVIFLRASITERLRRLQPRMGQEQSYKVNPDEQRIARLEETQLALSDPNTWIVIDTTQYTIEQVVQLILASIGRKPNLMPDS